MDFINITNLIILNEDKYNFLKVLGDWGMIPKEGTYKCPKCESILHLKIRKKALDGYKWACKGKISIRKQKATRCGREVSIRQGTFFENSKLPLVNILIFSHLWAESYKTRHIKYQASVNSKTYAVWAAYCRKVVLHYMLQNSNEKLGGVGKIVEIYETKLLKPKLNIKRIPEDRWFFGLYEKETGKVVMEEVSKKDRLTFMNLLKKWIAPGSTIISDCWKAYSSLPEEGYELETVNHFVGPVSDAHTESIESALNAAKLSILPANRKKVYCPGNLARYLLQKQCKISGEDCALKFFKLAGEMCNPMVPRFKEEEYKEEEYDDEEDEEEEDDEEEEYYEEEEEHFENQES